jgi:hypothetical protein
MLVIKIINITRIFLPYISLWHSLLAGACIILAYLTGVHISEALSTSSLFTFFSSEQAHLSWAPSQGPVDHYLLEITDTRLLDGSFNRNRLTTTHYATSPLPSYRLSCSHGHSYQVRVKAVSPSGISSAFSEHSVLFICDQKPPQLALNPLPSPHTVRSQKITLAGSFDEPHLASLTLNGTPAAIDPHTATFTATVTLAPGDNSLLLSARDLAGNTSTERTNLTYAPLTIISLPSHATLYWNGNYAYTGSYAGTTPQSFNQAGQHKQTLRISLPGFQDYYGIIDFSDLSRDTYLISLMPHAPSSFTQLTLLFPPEGVPLPFTRSHPFVVDYNLDGTKDLLVGTGDGTLALFLNRKSDATPALSDYTLLRAGDTLMDVGDNAAPFMADYNNDGAPDLLVGNGQGSLFYYENRGSASEPLFSASRLLTDIDGTPLAAGSDCSPCLVDWNGDARKDLLLGDGSGTLTLYLNEGTDPQPLFSSSRPLRAEEKTMGPDSHAAPFIADWNADGQQDLLLGRDGYVHVYYRTTGHEEPRLGATETIELNGQALMLDSAVVPFPVDWNQDGSYELILGSGEGSIYYVH